MLCCVQTSVNDISSSEMSSGLKLQVLCVYALNAINILQNGIIDHLYT